MTDNSNDRWGRRAVLRAGVTVGTAAVVAGCSGGSGDETDGNGDGPDTGGGPPSTDGEPTDGGPSDGETGPTVAFEDDFEDGDYTADPAWEAVDRPGESGGKAAEVVSASSPAGGTRGIRLTDVTDDRYQSPSDFSLADPMAGMSGQWTLTGLYSPVEIPADADDRFFGISCYWPHDGDFSNRAWVQCRFDQRGADDDAPAVRLRTQAQDNREWTIPAEATAPPLDTERWYRWELAHDGDGGYTARRWPADGEPADGVTVQTSFSAPAESVEFDVKVFSAGTSGSDGAQPDPGQSPYAVHLDYVRRTTE